MRYPARLGFLLVTLPALAQKPACKPTVTGHLETIRMTSSVFHNTRNLRVWLPPGYNDPANAQRKYPVLYLFDGASSFDACAAFQHDEMHADETLTELITSGKIPPIIAVSIDNASDILPHTPNGGNADNGQARAREYLPYPDTWLFPTLREVQGERLPDFFERDVMPLMALRYRALRGRENSALWGDSYAGAAALYIALQHPALFDRMIIESPSLQVGNGHLLRDSASLTQAPHRIALGVGTAEASGMSLPNETEINANAVRMMRTLADNLKAAAFTQTSVQLTVAEGAHHATGEFGKRFAAGLLFIYGKE